MLILENRKYKKIQAAILRDNIVQKEQIKLKLSRRKIIKFRVKLKETENRKLIKSN